MKFSLPTIISLVFQICFVGILMSQNTLNFYVYSKETNAPIPYSHAVNMNTNDGFLSNEEGLVVFNYKSQRDSVYISHLGFVDQKIPVNQIHSQSIIYLSLSSYTLEEVSVTARDERAYFLLKKSKRRLQKIKEIGSKAFLSIETESEGLPIEFLQGHYNAYTDNGSLESLELKAGRVALSQINSRYFVSLSTTHLLCNYSLLYGGHLPINPYQVRKPKRSFDMKVIAENDDEIVLSYIPIKDKSKRFEGKIWLSKLDFSILKISLKNDLVSAHPFRPIKPNDTLNNLGINLNITFHSDLNKGIKDVQFSYAFDYHFEPIDEEKQRVRRIKTNGYLYLYDIDRLYNPPLLEYISEHNDYRKISFIGFDPLFWSHHAKIANTSNQIKKLEYFKKNGFIVNFDDHQFDDHSKSSTFFENNNIKWKSADRWHIKSKEINLKKVEIIPKSKIAVQLFLDYFPIGDTMRMRSETILDVFNSEYYLPNTPRHNAYLNIYFDLCELERRSMMNRLKNITSPMRINEIHHNTILELNKKLKVYSRKTNYGENIEVLRIYNRDIINSLEVDNFKYFGIQ